MANPPGEGQVRQQPQGGWCLQRDSQPPAVPEGKPRCWWPWHAHWGSGQAEPASLTAENPLEELLRFPAGKGQLAISPLSALIF